jgi:hypothetical protein
MQQENAESSTMYKRCQELTLMNVAGMSHMMWPNPYKTPEWHQQIRPMRLRSRQSQTALQRHHRPPILWYLRSAASRRSHCGHITQIWVLEVSWYQKTNFGILFHHENGTYIRILFAYAHNSLSSSSLRLPSGRARNLPVAATLARQGHGKGNKMWVMI